jgi:hypothetical protein
MAANGVNGQSATYALSNTHKEVRHFHCPATRCREVVLLTHYQMLEKSLVDSDPEVAEIMVRFQ